MCVCVCVCARIYSWSLYVYKLFIKISNKSSSDFHIVVMESQRSTDIIAVRRKFPSNVKRDDGYF